MTLKDHFSEQPTDYAKYQPNFPKNFRLCHLSRDFSPVFSHVGHESASVSCATNRLLGNVVCDSGIYCGETELSNRANRLQFVGSLAKPELVKIGKLAAHDTSGTPNPLKQSGAGRLATHPFLSTTLAAKFCSAKRLR